MKKIIGMTSIERMANTLAHKSVDHIPVVINPWEATIDKWRQQGHLSQDEDVWEHFEQDIRTGGGSYILHSDHSEHPEVEYATMR
jgi:hypothetical protein